MQQQMPGIETKFKDSNAMSLGSTNHRFDALLDFLIPFSPRSANSPVLSHVHSSTSWRSQCFTPWAASSWSTSTSKSFQGTRITSSYIILSSHCWSSDKSHTDTPGQDFTSTHGELGFSMAPENLTKSSWLWYQVGRYPAVSLQPLKGITMYLICCRDIPWLREDVYGIRGFAKQETTTGNDWSTQP